MIAYMKAEFYRFTKKKSFALLLILFTIVYSSAAFFNRSNAGDLISFNNILIQMSPMLIGIAIFLMVYTDDISAYSLQIPIGYGLPRWKIVIAKLLEVIITFSLVMAYALALAGIINIIMPYQLDYSQLVSPILYALLTVALFSSFAGFLALVVQKSSVSIIAFVMLISNLVDSLLSLLFSIPFIGNNFPWLASYLPNTLLMNIYYDGMKSPSLPFVLAYIVVALAVTILTFNKSELDFA